MKYCMYVYIIGLFIIFSSCKSAIDYSDDIKINLSNYIELGNGEEFINSEIENLKFMEGILILIENNSPNDIFIYVSEDSLSFYPQKVHYMNCKDNTGATDIIDVFESVKLYIKPEQSQNVIFPVALGSLSFYDWIEMDVVCHITDTTLSSVNLTYKIDNGQKLVKIEEGDNPCN